MNSDFRKKIVAKNNDYELGSHYIDWVSTRGIHPKILTIKDYENLIHSEAMFARKMDAKVSQNLIEKLEKTF